MVRATGAWIGFRMEMGWGLWAVLFEHGGPLLEPVKIAIVLKLETQVIGNPLFACQAGRDGVDPLVRIDMAVGKRNDPDGTVLCGREMIVETGEAAGVDHERGMADISGRYIQKCQQTGRIGDGEVGRFAGR